ncbi:O-antigen ligase family protein [Novosphingobium soli]|uniref:O-antigen ligase family protein n=1 Tax=Novosphingobium soli TaxID=574956 RepID=A0ABV6CXM7_9SPHN
MNRAATGAQRLFLIERRKAEMENRRLLVSIGLVMLFLLSVVGTNLFFTSAIGTNATGGDAFRQIGIIAACVLLVIAQVEYPGTRPPMAIPISLAIVLGYCVLSLSWSLAPLISARRLILFGLTVWIVVRAVGDLGAVRTFNILRWTLVLLLLANFVAVYTTPLAVHSSSLGETGTTAGDWRGVFTHKNSAGPVLAITIMLFLFDRKAVPWLLCIPVILLSAYFLYKSNSKTSMLVLPPAILVGCAMLYYDPRQRFLVWAAILGALAAAAAAMLYSPTVAQIIDDPQAFTGRGRIWHVLLLYVRENPWFGAGYGAFWQIGPASPVYRLDNSWVAHNTGHGHNGYLDLIVTLGIPGMVLTVLVMLFWPTAKLLSAWQIGRQRRALLAAIIFYCALHNLSESSLLGSTPVQILLLIAVVLTHHLAAQSEGWHRDLRLRIEDRWKRLAT